MPRVPFRWTDASLEITQDTFEQTGRPGEREGAPLVSDYQRRLRERFLSVAETPPPAPWRPVLDRRNPIGGLLGIGFGIAPDTGHDLAVVVSTEGHGLFDAVTGEKRAHPRGRHEQRPHPLDVPNHRRIPYGYGPRVRCDELRASPTKERP
jgi:hypothetical protein